MKVILVPKFRTVVGVYCKNKLKIANCFSVSAKCWHLYSSTKYTQLLLFIEVSKHKQLRRKQKHCNVVHKIYVFAMTVTIRSNDSHNGVKLSPAFRIVFGTLDLWRWKHHVPSKRRETITQWHSVTSQKISQYVCNADALFCVEFWNVISYIIRPLIDAFFSAETFHSPENFDGTPINKKWLLRSK